MSERLSDFPNRKFSLEIFHFNLISSIQCTIENCPHNTKSHLKSWVFRAQKINNTNWLSRQCIPSPFAKHNVPELHNENSPMINVITGTQLKSNHWFGGFVHSPISSVFVVCFPSHTSNHGWSPENMKRLFPMAWISQRLLVSIRFRVDTKHHFDEQPKTRTEPNWIH